MIDFQETSVGGRTDIIRPIQIQLPESIFRASLGCKNLTGIIQKLVHFYRKNTGNRKQIPQSKGALMFLTIEPNDFLLIANSSSCSDYMKCDNLFIYLFSIAPAVGVATGWVKKSMNNTDERVLTTILTRKLKAHVNRDSFLLNLCR
jgi:hypothetical protein